MLTILGSPATGKALHRATFVERPRGTDATPGTKEQSLVSALYRFDFGTKASKVFPGFQQVTGEDEYDRKRGYGWRGARSSVERVTADWSPVNPDPLCYDFVHAQNASFELDLANGDYEVVVIAGDIGPAGVEVVGLRSGYRIAAQGRRTVDVPPLDDQSFRQWLWQYADDDWQPGRSIWDRYIAPRYHIHRFAAAVTQGKLLLGFRDCPVCMLAVYRARDGERIEEELRRLDKARRVFFPFREIRYPDPRSFPALTAEETRNGYLTFVRHYLDEVFPNTVPQREEVRREMKIFAAANEYEPATFAIHALEKLQEVQVTVSDLVSQRGEMIPRTDVAVQSVRYVECVQAGEKAFRVCPHILETRKRMDVPKGINKWVWLTVHVRKGTAPGSYRGAVAVAPRGRPASRLTLLVEVLPFELPERVKGKHYAILCNWPDPPAYGDVWERYAKRFPDLKAHGMETLYIAGDPFRPVVSLSDGRVQDLDTTFLDKTMALYRDVGMSEGRVMWNTNFDLAPLAGELAAGDPVRRDDIYRQLLQRIESRAKRQAWPEIYYAWNSSDGASLETQLPRDKTLRSAQVKVWDQQCHPETIQGVAEFVDAVYMNVSYDRIRPLVAEFRKKGKEVGFMNYPLIFYHARFRDIPLLPGAYRMHCGWWLWRTGAQLMGDEFYELALFGQPYNPFDSTLPETQINDFSGVASPSPAGEPRPHIRYEWMREGRDDMRYIALLEQRIAEAKSDRSPGARSKAAEAELFLKTTAEAIRIEEYAWFTCQWWPIARYDQLRRTVAGYIVDLDRLLRRDRRGHRPAGSASPFDHQRVGDAAADSPVKRDDGPQAVSLLHKVTATDNCNPININDLRKNMLVCLSSPRKPERTKTRKHGR